MARALGALETVLGRLTKVGEIVDYGAAFISGAIDGFLIKKSGFAFIAKNVGGALAGIFIPALPRGFVNHCVGQLGMIVVLMVAK